MVLFSGPRSPVPTAARAAVPCAACAMGVLLITAFSIHASQQEVDNSEAVLEQMQRRVEKLQVWVVEEGSRAECKRVEKPVFRYSDPARETVDGTLWLWTHEGRPAALLCLFTVPTDWKSWNYEWTSLIEKPVLATGRDWWKWTPGPVKHEWLEVETTPPADTKPARLLQMKRILRRFIAYETLGREEYELRRLTQPIHRYAAPSEGVTDGALFAMVYGTNPEVIVQIEARDDGRAKAWFVAFAPASSARLSVQEEGTDVWKHPAVSEFEETAPYYSAYGPDPLQD